MPALSSAALPTAFVTAIPGRFAPPYIVDRRTPGSVTTSTATSSRNVFLPRAESVSMDFTTPTTPIEELGTNYRVGEYDSLPDAKVSISSYDVGTQAISLITGKATPTGTTTFTAADLNAALVDLVVNYADPNGNIFYSEYMGDLLIEEYGISLKQKASAMENFSLVGTNQLGFRGFFVTKAYVVQAADVTAHGFTIAAALGASEAPVPFPVPSGGQPPNFWVQRGCINYVKIERWRSATGWTRYTEVASSPVASVSCTATTGGAFGFATVDLVAGDLFYITYATYGASVTGYTAIPTTTIDTSDALAVDTRLTPITINAGAIARGQSLDIKIQMKRNRVEGIGDTVALYGPSEQPNASIGLDVKFTGGSIDSLARTGFALGTDGGNTTTGDFIDANYDTRVMLNTPTPIVATVKDPRNSATTLKTITAPNAVFKQRTLQMQAKNDTSLKFTGEDQVGNISIAYTH